MKNKDEENDDEIFERENGIINAIQQVLYIFRLRLVKNMDVVKIS